RPTPAGGQAATSPLGTPETGTPPAPVTVASASAVPPAGRELRDTAVTGTRIPATGARVTGAGATRPVLVLCPEDSGTAPATAAMAVPVAPPMRQNLSLPITLT